MAINITENGVVRYENEPNVDRLLFPNTPDCGYCSEQIDELKENLTDLYELADTKAPVIYGSASGSIASFSDGADDMPLKSCVVSIEPIQEGTGDPSPENIRPISGQTGLSVVLTGKNLLNLPVRSSTVVNGITSSVTENNLVTASGESTGNGDINFDLTDNIVLKADQAYTLSLNGTDTRSGNFTVFFRNAESGSFITVGAITTTNHSITYTPSEDIVVNYIKLRLPVGITIELNANLQLELGSTATDYEPYKGSTYSVNWETEVGTVYGGYVDVVSGKLTVDRAKRVFDGSEPWAAYPSFEGYLVWNGTMKQGLRQSGHSNMLKSSTSTDPEQKNTLWLGVNTKYIYVLGVYESMGSTVENFKTYLSTHNLEIEYPLATPTEIQLTGQEVRTLLGVNNIWSDGGDVEVEYPADTKLYIQRVTGSEEGDMVANSNIPDATYFLINNTLYKSTTAIASGDPIVPGTNCSVTNIAEALNALNTTT